MILVVTSMLIWGISYPVVKILLERDIPPITLATLRTIIFVPMLLTVIIRGSLRRYRPRDFMLCFAIAFFTVFLPNISQNMGMLYTTASVSSVIQSTSPIFTVMFAFVFLKERKTLNKIIGSIVGLIGAILLTTNGKLDFDITTFGNLLILISSISYAISGILIKEALRTIEPFDLLTLEISFGFFMLLIPNFIFEDVLAIASFDFKIWSLILFLSIFAGVFASLIYYFVLKEEEISYLAVFSYLIPVFAIASSYILLGEILGIWQVLFTLVILSGIVITEMGHR